MRVGILVYGLDRPLTGIGRYTVELVKALHSSGACPDIVLLCAGTRGPLDGEVDFRAVPLPGSRLLPGLMTIGQGSILCSAKRLGLDLIHDPTGVTPLLLSRRQVKTVVTVHDVFAWSHPGTSSLLDTILYRVWLPCVLPRMDAVITVSEHSRREILRHVAPPADRVQIIHAGVSPAFRPLPEDDVQRMVQDRFFLSSPYVLYVGALTLRKNIERVIEAFARIADGFPHHRLVLVGPNSWRQTPVEAVLHRFALEERVLLTGPVAEQELPALYNGADCFIFPSLYEGFGLPVLEAMACGTPVVTSNCSSLPEVAGDAAILVDPHDVAQIAHALWLVLSQPGLAAQMREKGLVRAQEFGWARTARETVAVYEQVLGINHR